MRSVGSIALVGEASPGRDEPPVGRGWPVPPWALGLAGLWAGLVWTAEKVGQAHGIHPALCLFRHATGVPCPTCGSTRAGLALLRGDILGALGYNPLMTMVLMAAPAALLWLHITGTRRDREAAPRPRALSARARAVAWACAIAAVGANWVFVLATGGR